MKKLRGLTFVLVVLLVALSASSALAGKGVPPQPWGPNLPLRWSAPGHGMALAEAVGASVGGPINRNVTFLAQYGGEVEAVAVKGDRAYVGVGPRVEVLDISDPAHPQLLGRTPPLAGVVDRIVLVGNYAYVAAEYAGMLVVDVSDPTNPRKVGGCDTPGVANDIEVSGSYAYIADAWGGLRIIDISDPVKPKEVGAYNDGNDFWGVAVSGSYAYMADNIWVNDSYGGHGEAVLRVVDVSNPSAPHLLGSYEYASEEGFADSIAVSGEYVYMAAGLPGLLVIDVSDPAAPSMIARYSVGGTVDVVAVSDGYAYVADWSNARLRVVDIGDPSNPYEVSSYYTQRSIEDIAISGGYAYAAEGDAFQVIDVSDPANLRGTGYYSPSGGSYYDAAISGRYLYLTTGRGFDIVDVSTPSTPYKVGSYEAATRGAGIAVVGNYAYVASGGDGLRVVDVSDPAYPKEVGSYDTPGWANDVVIAGNYAYVADGDQGIRVIDVSDPAALHEVGSYGTPGYAVGIFVSGHYAYVAAGDSGLDVVDVSDPTNPHEVGSYDTPGWANRVFVSSEYAYVADGSKGLCVIDVSDPANPHKVSSLGTPDFASSVLLSGGYLYIGSWWGGLRVVDVADPASPYEAGYYDTAGSAEGIAVNGEYVYVADREGGLVVLRFVPFVDVAPDHWAKAYIDRLYNAGVTGGCALNPLRYCPDNPVTRAQMAVFLEKGMHYPNSYSPPDVKPTFPDTAGHWAEDWIEALKSDGITSGFPDGTYRPESPVTRAQMAVFLLKAKHGAGYQPPAVDHSRFSDVPDGHWAKAWIEELAAEGITSGYPDGTYRPENPVSRAEMSVFLVKTFGLP